MYQLVVRDWHCAIEAPPCFFVIEADLYGQTGDLTVGVYHTVLDPVKIMYNDKFTQRMFSWGVFCGFFWGGFAAYTNEFGVLAVEQRK